MSSTERWYTLVYERPMYDDMPERCRLFPSYLREEQRGDGYILHAEYPDGFKEKFVSFAELEFRFSARRIDAISTTGGN